MTASHYIYTPIRQVSLQKEYELLHQTKLNPHSSMSISELNTLISSHLHHNRPIAAISLFRSNPHRRNTTTYNLILSCLIRSNRTHEAQQLFDEIPKPDAVSYNTLLSVLLRIRPLRAFALFLRMIRLRVAPTGYTLSSVLSSPPDPVVIPQVHAIAVRSGLTSNTFVGTALISGYTNLKDPACVMRALDEIEVKNSVTWTAAINGLMCLRRVQEARLAFGTMLWPTVAAQTTLLHGYIANGDLISAWEIFNRVVDKNVVMWTAMINGCNRFGRFRDALRLFVTMGLDPNAFTYSAALAASAGIPSFLAGASIHARILKSGTPSDAVMSTSLVEMYGKCGDADAAIRAFEESDTRNTGTWNSVIGACGRNGRTEKALEFSERMLAGGGDRPDGVTLVNVLTACVHGGMVEEGERWAERMEREFGIGRGIEHYGCLVDLYQRAGREEEAKRVVEEMPMAADVAAMTAVGKSSGGAYERRIRECGEREEWGSMGELKEERERVVGNRKGRGVSWLECNGAYPS